jgi:formate hydrogenlyase transcriptional activator
MTVVSNLQRYGLATVCCGLALVLAWPLDAPSSCFFLAVMMSSLYGGKGPGLYAVGLSSLAFDYFFLPPQYHLLIEPSSYLRFGVFVGAALLIIWVIETRHQGEEARRRINEQYRTVAETADDAIISIDDEDQITFVNPAATRAFGRKASELLGQKVTMLMPNFHRELRKGVRELVGLRHDGTQFPVEVSFGEIVTGQQHTFTGFVRDISEKKRAADALRKSESYLAEAQKLSLTGSFGWNVETGELFWSEETFRIVGFAPGTKPTLDLIFERIHPEDRGSVQKTFDHSLLRGTDLDFEHRFLMPDGSVKHVHVLAHAARDESGALEYMGAVTDVTATRKAETELRRSEAYLTEAQRLGHAGSWAWDVHRGETVYWSAEMYEIYEREPSQGPPLTDDISQVHGSDWPLLIAAAQKAAQEKIDIDETCRIALPNGASKNIRIVGHPVVNAAGEVVELVGTTIDITEQYRARVALQNAYDEIKKSEEQFKTIINTVPALAWRTEADGSAEFLNQRWLDYTGLSLERARGWEWKVAIHPEDLPHLMEEWLASMSTGMPFEVESRLRRFDGEFRWFLFRARPLRDEAGNILKWYGTNTDIEDRKRAEGALRKSEHELRLIIDTIPGFAYTETAAGEIELVNQPLLDYTGKTLQQLRDGPTTLHPEDSARSKSRWEHSVETGAPYDAELRIRRADGAYRWFHARSLPLRDSAGRVVRWYSLFTDIEDRKRAEEALRTSEQSLRLLVESIPGFVFVTSADGRLEYVNQRILDYSGKDLRDFAGLQWDRMIHPTDLPVAIASWVENVAAGLPHEAEWRFLGADGAYRWFHNRVEPLLDGEGRVIRWYGLLQDIDERKNAEEALHKAFVEIKGLRDQLYQENLALREDIDQTSMFEEIVGSSEALRRVLSQVARVAPTNSTVLILGETGTGKELIARAIHNRSDRANRAFIRVNCAAIPPSLIASELFGHEKGAFTGAVQRRLGRFELAHGGTIFLDEIGELPAETQITLLRVLQEREFERVGGSQPISVDVRVLAATNRDLSSAITAGAFRQDLFYRLNVFPIQIPSLRERMDDIPILVEYLIERYAKKAGKRIRNIRKKTLDLFQAYDWPGNIRELQNVVERAVVLSDSDTFSVDETWLQRAVPQKSPALTMAERSLGRLDADQEKEIIEAALSECGGRIAGPFGAAAKLGIPRQTLDSKINSLGINKNRFKSA